MRDTQIRAQQHDEDAEDKDAESHEEQALVGDELPQGRVVCQGRMYAGQQHAVSQQGRDEGDAEAAHHKGTADETPAGPHQFHGMDEKTTAIISNYLNMKILM